MASAEERDIRKLSAIMQGWCKTNWELEGPPRLQGSCPPFPVCWRTAHSTNSLTPTACLLSHFSRVWLFVTLWTAACQAPLSMGFSRQECWSGLPCSSPGDLPHSGIEPGSPTLQADSLPSETPWKPLSQWRSYEKQNYIEWNTEGEDGR